MVSFLFRKHNFTNTELTPQCSIRCGVHVGLQHLQHRPCLARGYLRPLGDPWQELKCCHAPSVAWMLHRSGGASIGPGGVETQQRSKHTCNRTGNTIRNTLTTNQNSLDKATAPEAPRATPPEPSTAAPRQRAPSRRSPGRRGAQRPRAGPRPGRGAPRRPARATSPAEGGGASS